jgi:hypothetical protein
MANEFYYCVSLSIIHPSIDPSWISQMIPSLRPRIKAMAGAERCGKDGKPLTPSRKVLLSHWLADLHEETQLYSDAKPLSDFILEKVTELGEYRHVVAQLVQEGEVVFRIGWFSESNNSAGVLNAKTLKACGELGVDIELNFYSPNQVAGQDSPLSTS